MSDGWRFEPTAVRTAYRDTAAALVDVARRIPDDGWDRPGLGVWTIRDLVGHAGRALSVTETYLDAGGEQTAATATLQRPLDYYRAIAAGGHADHDAVAERGRQAGRELGEAVSETLAALADRVVARIAEEADTAILGTPFGTMALIDYLPSRVFELTVHRLDTVEAAGLEDVDGRPGVELSLIVAAGIAGMRPDASDTLLAVTGRRDLPRGFSIV